MNIAYKILTVVAGSNVVASASLLGAVVLEVDKEGIGYNESPFAANWQHEREYKFRPVFGQIIFNPIFPFPAGEKVYVLYKK